MSIHQSCMFPSPRGVSQSRTLPKLFVTTTAPAEKDSAWSMYDADLDGPILDCVSTDTDGDDEWHGSAVIITWNCQRTKLWSR